MSGPDSREHMYYLVEIFHPKFIQALDFSVSLDLEFSCLSAIWGEFSGVGSGVI